MSGIDIAALTGVPPAADTDCRLAVTPETVYSPTLAGRRSKPRNLILCLARAGFEPTTSSTAVQRLTTVPTRQAKLLLGGVVRESEGPRVVTKTIAVRFVA